MGSHHRKILLEPPIIGNNITVCCPLPLHKDEENEVKCCFSCPKAGKNFTKSLIFSCNDVPPPLDPLPRQPSHDNSLRELAYAGMAVLACVIIAALLLCILCAVGRAYYLRRNRNRSRRADPPIIFATQEGFLDEDHGPEVDHHIWYINTVGLPQSVIDSISVFKYDKGEGLIDGTECSVCLSEFQEDESLRLLPKCSHAFHITCIDTWLRSHTNCPLCRAPIVSGAVVPQATESGSSSRGLGARNENTVENYSGEGSSGVGESGTIDVRIGHDNNGVLSSDEEIFTAKNSNKTLPSCSKARNGDSDSRVLSDLAYNRRVIEEDMQPIRRSVSLDVSSASLIYDAVAGGVVCHKHQGSLGSQIMNSKRSKSKIVSKRSGGSSSISKLMKSTSSGIGSSLQKGPISMKRSVSSGGKCSSPRHSRRHSILPL